MRHTAVIPIAGDLITSAIAMALRAPTKDAEKIKVEHGVARQLLADHEGQDPISSAIRTRSSSRPKASKAGLGRR